MGNTIRAGGSAHRKSVIVKRDEKRQSRHKELEEAPNFKQMSKKVATEYFSDKR